MPAFSPLTGAYNKNIQISLSALLVSGCLIIFSCFSTEFQLRLSLSRPSKPSGASIHSTAACVSVSKERRQRPTKRTQTHARTQIIAYTAGAGTQPRAQQSCYVPGLCPTGRSCRRVVRLAVRSHGSKVNGGLLQNPPVAHSKGQSRFLRRYIRHISNPIRLDLLWVLGYCWKTR